MMQVRCSVSSSKPLTCTLTPDLPAYEACELTVEYTDALLADLGPSLLMLYASFAGPPITREALVEITEPVVCLSLDACERETLLNRVRAGYAPVLARGRERVEALGG